MCDFFNLFYIFMYACFPKLKEKNLAHLKSNEQWEEGVQRAWAVVLTVLSLAGDMSCRFCDVMILLVGAIIIVRAHLGFRA